MTPSTTQQNLALWGGALAVSLVLAFLSGVATHWPEAGPIDWRGVALDCIQVLLSELPIVAAGLGLPRLGKETVAALTSKVGTSNAVAVLSEERDRQAGIPVPSPLTDADLHHIAQSIDIGALADRVLAENESRQTVAAETRQPETHG